MAEEYNFSGVDSVLKEKPTYNFSGVDSVLGEKPSTDTSTLKPIDNDVINKPTEQPKEQSWVSQGLNYLSNGIHSLVKGQSEKYDAGTPGIINDGTNPFYKKPEEVKEDPQVVKTPTPEESFANTVYDKFKRGLNYVASNQQTGLDLLPQTAEFLKGQLPFSFEEKQNQVDHPTSIGDGSGNISMKDFFAGAKSPIEQRSDAFYGKTNRQENIPDDKSKDTPLIDILKNGAIASRTFPTISGMLDKKLEDKGYISPDVMQRADDLGLHIAKDENGKFVVEQLSMPKLTPEELAQTNTDTNHGFNVQINQAKDELSDAKAMASGFVAKNSQQYKESGSEMQDFLDNQIYSKVQSAQDKLLDIQKKKEESDNLYTSFYASMKQKGHQPEANIATKSQQEGADYNELSQELNQATQNTNKFLSSNLEQYHMMNGAGILNASNTSDQVTAKKDILHQQSKVFAGRSTTPETLQKYLVISASGDIESLKSTVERDQLLLNKINTNITAIRGDGKKKNIPVDQVEDQLDKLGYTNYAKALSDNIDARKREIEQDQLLIDTKTPDYKRFLANQTLINEQYKKSPVAKAIGTDLSTLIPKLRDSFATFDVQVRHFLSGDKYEDINKSVIYEATKGLESSKQEPFYLDKEKHLRPISEMPAFEYDSEGRVTDWHGPAIAYQTTDMSMKMLPFVGIGYAVDKGIIMPLFTDLISTLKAGEEASVASNLTGEALGLGETALKGNQQIYKAARLTTQYAVKPVVGTLAEFVLPGNLTMNDPKGIVNEMEKNGGHFDLATQTMFFRTSMENAMFAVAPEQMNAIKAAFVEGTLKNVAENSVYENIAKTNWKYLTGQTMSDGLYNFIHNNAPELGYQYLKTVGAVSLQQDLSLGINHLTDLYLQGQNPAYQKEYDITSEKLMNNTWTAMATMLPMSILHGFKGAEAVRNSQYSSLFVVAESPEKYLHGISERLNNGEITKDEALRQTKIIQQADDIHKGLKSDYDEVDKNLNLEDKEKSQLKFELFKNKVNEKGIVDKLLEAEAKQVRVDVLKSTVITKDTNPRTGVTTTKTDKNYETIVNDLGKYLNENTEKYNKIKAYMEFIEALTPEQREVREQNIKLRNFKANLDPVEVSLLTESGKSKTASEDFHNDITGTHIDQFGRTVDNLSPERIGKIKEKIYKLQEIGNAEKDPKLLEKYKQIIDKLDLIVSHYEFHKGIQGEGIARHINDLGEVLEAKPETKDKLTVSQQLLVDNYPNALKAELDRRGLESDWVKPKAPEAPKEEETSNLKKEKDRVSTISNIDELNKEKKAAYKNKNLTEEERSELADHIREKIRTLENKANTITFGEGDKAKTFEKNTLVKVTGHEGLYKVHSLDGDRLLVRTGKSDEHIQEEADKLVEARNAEAKDAPKDKKKEIIDKYQVQIDALKKGNEIKVSDPEDVTIASAEDKASFFNDLAAKKKAKEDKETKDKEPKELTLEEKKADINKRKQEELKQLDKDSDKKKIEQYFAKKFEKDFPEINPDGTNAGWINTIQDALGSQLTQEEHGMIGKYKYYEQNKASIEKKYDAELKTLEPETKPKEPEKTTEELNNEFDNLTTRLEDLLSPVTPYPTDVEFQEAHKESLEILSRLKELSNKLGREVEVNLERKPKKSEKEEVKEHQDKAEHITIINSTPSWNPFGTAPQQITKTGDASNEPIVQAQINTFERIKNEVNEANKTPNKLGYFITIQTNSFPVDSRHQKADVIKDAKGGEPSWLREGVIAVITDDKGEIKYFNPDGTDAKPNTGHPVYQNLKGKLVNGKLEFGVKQPSKEELENEGMLEQYDSELSRLENVRQELKTNPNTKLVHKIGVITNGFVAFSEPVSVGTLDNSDYRIEVGESGLPKIQYLPTGTNLYLSYETLGDSNIKDDLHAILDMKNTEGLPEELKNDFNARRSYVERFIYTTGKGEPKKRLILDTTTNAHKTTDGRSIDDYRLNVDWNLIGKKMTYYEFKNGVFTPQEINYNEFIKDNFKVKVPELTPKNAYIKIGDPIVRIEPTPVTPVLKEEIKPTLTSPELSKLLKEKEEALTPISIKSIEKLISNVKPNTRNTESLHPFWNLTGAQGGSQVIYGGIGLIKEKGWVSEKNLLEAIYNKFGEQIGDAFYNFIENERSSGFASAQTDEELVKNITKNYDEKIKKLQDNQKAYNPLEDVDIPSTNESVIEKIKDSKEISQNTLPQFEDIDIEIGKGLDDLEGKPLQNSISTDKITVTPEEMAGLKDWFDKYLAISGASFNDFMHIVNSNARGDWFEGAITLWHTADFTTAVHEAWHDFTQLYLTPEQKIGLYEETAKTSEGLEAIRKAEEKKKEKLTDDERYHAVDEMIADDFIKYKVSGGTKILGGRPKRNSIFRRIYNFLKELITGIPSLQSVYEKLGDLNFANLKRDKNNAIWGKLNKAMEGLDFEESVGMYKLLDAMVANAFRDRGLVISKFFKSKEYIDSTYNTILSTLKNTYREELKNYNDLNEKWNKSTDDEKQALLPQVSSQAKLLKNIGFILKNPEAVKAKHLAESDYLKVSKKYIPEDILDEAEPEVKDAMYDDKDSQSVRDKASDQLIFLMASLKKFENKGGEKVPVWNSFVSSVQDINDFDSSWNTLAKALTGVRDYGEQWKKIIELTKTNPEYKDLLTSLPNPTTSGADLDLLTNQLRVQFNASFSQPIVPVVTVNIYKNDKGELQIDAKPAGSKAIPEVRSLWKDNIQEVSNPYRIVDPQTGQNYVDMDKISTDFKNIKNSVDARKEKFLDALGISFSPETKESPEYKELLTSPKLETLYSTIKAFSDMKAGKNYPKGYIPTEADKEFFNTPVVSVLDAISNTRWGKDSNYLEREGHNPTLIKGQKDNIDAIAKIEVNNSTKYTADNVLNSEGNSIFAIRPWSQQTVVYNILNNPKFKTYQNLINHPLGAYFDISKNPDADNIYLHSLFDLSTGERRKDRKGKSITIDLHNFDGMSITDSDNRTDGKKSSSLSRSQRLIQDISPVLLTGHKAHPQNGDKTTTNGTTTRFTRITDSGGVQYYLPVDIADFKNSYLPKEAKAVFRPILISALQLTNDYFAKGIGKNADNFTQNLEKRKAYWGYFDKIFSKDTKDALIKDGLIGKDVVDIPALVDKHQDIINKDIEDFLKKDTERIIKELKENKVLKPSDYIKAELLKKTQFGETENERFNTLLRAFNINSYIMNLEHTRLMFQDPRFYDNNNLRYREPFKRYSKATSTGVIGVNDDQMNQHLTKYKRLEREQYNKENPGSPAPEITENGIENSIVLSDVMMSADDMLKTVDKDFRHEPLKERLAIRKSFEDMETTNAMGVCTFDWYRNWCKRTGNDQWNDEKEELYAKLAKGEELSKEDIFKSFAFFPPLKIRVVGNMFDSKSGQYLPVDYKFAVSPLLSSVVKDKAWGDIRKNMLRQNVSLATFKSASKHSSILNDSGEHDKMYNEDGTVYTGDYTLNPIHTEYIFEVVPSPKDYKGEITSSTQERAILFVNSFEHGIPVDYKGKKDWNSLSEQERKAKSYTYRLEQKYGETIQKIVEIKKEGVLKQLDAKVDERGNFTINDDKFSEYLEKEFNNRNMPYNVYKSVQTVDGKMKYPLDASLYRETIEQVIISIIDNKIRKQKSHGESLIHQSLVGYEPSTFERVDSWKSINGNDLPFYKRDGRTVMIGGKPTKVTALQKVKIALQGDFKKLLNLPDVKQKASQEGITRQEALNKLLKNEDWLDKRGVRDMVTISGDRIPVQGNNSMEAGEVYEFLPEEAGPVIITSTGAQTKSGTDNDLDKLTTPMPSIHYNPYTGEVKLYRENTSSGKADSDAIKQLKEIQAKNISKIQKIYEFKQELQDALTDYKADRNFAKLAKQDLIRSNRLLDLEVAVLQDNYDQLKDIYDTLVEGEINNPMQKVVKDILGNDVDYTHSDVVEAALNAHLGDIRTKLAEIERIKTQLLPIIKEALDSSKEDINYTRASLKPLEEDIEGFKKFNGYLSEQIFKNSPIKGLQNELINIKKSILQRREFYNQLVTPNSTYMFEPIGDARQKALEDNNPGYSDIPTVHESLNQFESNNVGKQALSIGAVWNKFFSQLQKGGVLLNKTYLSNLDYPDSKHKVTQIRLPHNIVDGKISISGIETVLYKNPKEKEPTKYKISEEISQLMNGWLDVAKKNWIFYVNGIKEIAPVMIYAATTGIHKDVLVGFFNQPIIYDFIKSLQNYNSDLVKLHYPELQKNAKLNALYDTIEKYIPEGTKVENNFGDMADALGLLKTNKDNNEAPFFYGTLNKGFRQLANSHKDLFEPEKFMRFAIPDETTGKLDTPNTKEDNLAQVLYLIQYLEFEEQQKIVDKLRRSINQDTSKPLNLQHSKQRQADREELENHELIDEKYIDKMASEGTTRAFTNSKTGIDKFLQNLTAKTFEITNHKVLNDFMYKEFNKPTKENNIPFGKKFGIYEKWVKTFKNDLILSLYQNYVYNVGTNSRIVDYVVNNMMQYDTALALELENIKKTMPEEVSNNKLLDYLIRDNSKEKEDGKPVRVNLKLKKDRIETSTSNVLTEGYDKLLNSPNPALQQFAKKLGYLAFIQSGLNKSPISFANIISQDAYGKEITPIIHGFKDLMDNHPEKALDYIKKYNEKFKSNNKTFYVANKIKDDEDKSKLIDDIDFESETYRFKDYRESDIYDLMNIKKNVFLESLKRKTKEDETPWTAETAIEHPRNFYLYESDASNGLLKGSAIIKQAGDNIPNIAPIITLASPLTSKPTSFWTDDTYEKNINKIDISVDKAVALIRKANYNNILLPSEGITSVSKLKEKAPKTFLYLRKRLLDTFNVDISPEVVVYKEPSILEKEEKPEMSAKLNPIKVGNSIVAEHAEDYPTAQDKINGQKSTELTPEGKEQASKLGIYMKDNGITKIWNSPIGRAKDTADIIQKEQGIPHESKDLLKTWNLGTLELKPNEKFDRKFWTDKLNENTAPAIGAESFREVRERALDAWKWVKTLPADEAVIAHSTMMELFKIYDELGENAFSESNIEYKNLPKALSIKEPMNYSMPKLENIHGKNTTTFNLIDEGKRTSTTRGYWHNIVKGSLKSVNDLEGKIITFTSPEGKSINVEVTSVHKITKEDRKNPEFLSQWSKKEGWTKEHLLKNTKIGEYQVEFKKVEKLIENQVSKLSPTYETAQNKFLGEESKEQGELVDGCVDPF